MDAVIIEALVKRYGRHRAVDGLTLAVPEGSLFGFLGPNGSGKTTAIRVLMGMLRADGGGARVFGCDCWRESPRIKRELGYLPGDLRLYPWLSARAGLRMSGRIRGVDVQGFGATLTESFALDPLVCVRNMSHGMRQKLGLILALAHRPRLLILDEPTTALDPLVQQTLYGHLRALRDAGHTVFFSSHTLGEVEQLCDRVAILRDGRLTALETLEALRSRAKRLVVLRWGNRANEQDQRAPDCLRVVERRGAEWECLLEGPVAELVRWAATAPLDDLAIGKPDLATLFHEYYGRRWLDPGVS